MQECRNTTHSCAGVLNYSASPCVHGFAALHVSFEFATRLRTGQVGGGAVASPGELLGLEAGGVYLSHSPILVRVLPGAWPHSEGRRRDRKCGHVAALIFEVLVGDFRSHGESPFVIKAMSMTTTTWAATASRGTTVFGIGASARMMLTCFNPITPVDSEFQ